MNWIEPERSESSATSMGDVVLCPEWLMFCCGSSTKHEPTLPVDNHQNNTAHWSTKSKSKSKSLTLVQLICITCKSNKNLVHELFLNYFIL